MFYQRSGGNRIVLIFLVALLLGISACSTPRHDTALQTPARSGNSVNLRNQGAVKALLLQQYKEWYKTPYRMGGMSKKGVDCSGFTYLTFHSKLGYTIPRSTDRQVLIGTKVPRGSLHVGDLIFFHTSAFYNHVGIYLGDATFLHASTSRGVMISSMKLEYWANRYWTARRISD